MDYRVLPIPAELRGPSGERGQIEIAGRARRVTLFHGRYDEEFDWHIYFCLDLHHARLIGEHLRANGESFTDGEAANVYSELMLIDRWRRRGLTWPPWEAPFQRRYDSADLTAPLRLRGAHRAYELGRIASDDPGENHDFSRDSRLVTDPGRVHMQGLLVADTGHSPNRLELHPPDGTAFAIDESKRTIATDENDPSWPKRAVRWRVAWFANSDHHRVNDAVPEVRQRRTTTWYLPLPGDAVTSSSGTSLNSQTFQITVEPIRLWDSREQDYYDDRGVNSIEDAVVAVDPRDNKKKLRVSATMDAPRKKGGLLVRDYIVRVRDQVSAPT